MLLVASTVLQERRSTPFSSFAFQPERWAALSAPLLEANEHA